MKTLNNFLFQDRDLTHDVYLRSLHRITQVYLFLMLLVFPFYSTNCDRRLFIRTPAYAFMSHSKGRARRDPTKMPADENGLATTDLSLQCHCGNDFIGECESRLFWDGWQISGTSYVGPVWDYVFLYQPVLAHESGSDPSVFIGRYHFFGMGNYGFFRYGYLRLDWPCKTGTANHVFFFLRKHQYLYRCHFIGRRCISWHDCFCRDNAA